MDENYEAIIQSQLKAAAAAHTLAAAAARPLEFEVSRVENPNLKAVSCRPRLVCGMTFPILCLTPDR